jgi:hypothetical protein
MTAYQIKLCDDDENIIGLIDNSLINHLEWAIVENDVGTLTFTMPQMLDYTAWTAYRTVILERDAGAGYSIVENRRWFVLGVAHYSTGGADYTEVICKDQNEILNGFVVAYADDTTYSEKTDEYDDICKLVVTENIVSPVDTTRTIAGITVAAGTGDAPSATMSISYQNLLSVCQECANASWEAGTYLVFDLVNTGAGTFEMRTYVGQHGVDHTADSDDPRVIALEEGRLEVDFSDSANYIYATDPVKTADKAVWRSGSKFARREVHISASADDELAVQAAAKKELYRRRPRRTITGQIVDTPGVRYGVDYGWGDLVSAQYKNSALDAHICAVGATYDAGNETLNISVRGEA